jgi:hypothetical protein
MAGQTVSAHLDKDVIGKLREVMRGDDRPASQIIATALKAFLDIPPGARRSIHSLHGAGSDEEKEFLARFMGRQILRAHHTIVESRYLDAARNNEPRHGSNVEPQTEEEIEAEAARVCKSM